MADPTGPAAVPEDPGLGERHATNLELFLDLVFVFAVTQIALLIEDHLTVAGVLRGVLLAFLVWWQWSQFTWAGAARDLQAHTVSRLMVLCMVPVTLLMAVSIPGAYGRSGPWFGWAYFGVQVLVISMMGALTVHGSAQRRAYVRYASLALLSPTVVLLGGYLHGDARIVAWCVAAALDIVAALLGGGGEWALNATHFAERHALFIIIALGEVVVAAGATAFTESQADGLRAPLVLALGVVVGVTCVLWWTYFAYIPQVGEHLLAGMDPVDRGRFARDFYTYGHFPLVLGVVLYSVVAGQVVAHPHAPLPEADRWILAVAVLLYLGGLDALRFRVWRVWSPERVAAIAVSLLFCAVGGSASGVLLVGAVGIVLGLAQIVRLRRYRKDTATT